MTHRSTLVIAEAGVNHNGDLVTALSLVDVANESGADIVKFQTFTADQLVTQDAAKAEYQKAKTSNTETQFEMLRRLELSHNDHLAIIERCQERGIGFLSTGFDIGNVDMLVGLGMDRIKIPSGEITNLPYLRHIGGLGLPTILSTGMADLEEVRDALNVLLAYGSSKCDVTILHCTTDYPAAMGDVNLQAMVTMGDAFGVEVGYSDHTLGYEVPVSAVALGAVVIEKHLTLGRESAGPDHAASLEPEEFANMVRAIRNIEIALGDGIKRPQSNEFANMAVTRKSLVASEHIREGEVFTSMNIAAKRPGSGLSPMLWDEVLGQNATRAYAPNEMIEL
jgi:N,N'-diacetyllegionaminate synthase